MTMLWRLLERKGSSVLTIGPDETVLDAIKAMATNDVGSLVVVDGETLVGMFTERDLVKRVVGPGKQPGTLMLRDVATTDCLISVPYDTTCEEAINKMRSNHCRRLLVYRGDRFIGLVNLPNLAFALTGQQSGRNILANVFVGIAVALGFGAVVTSLMLTTRLLWR